MKKLLGLLAVAPMAITACGGSSSGLKYSVQGVVTASHDDSIDKVDSGDVDIAGSWGDVRKGAHDDVVAVGITQSRIANDGIQARPDMDAHDMAAIQDLFLQLLTEDITIEIDGEDEHVFEVYGHEGYSATKTTTKETSYLSKGKSVLKEMVTKAPLLDNTNGGSMFGANGELKDGETLKIQFIPSTDTDDASRASKALQDHLNASYTGDYVVSVAASQDASAIALENGTVDLSFLSVNTWAELAPTSQFILQAGRSAQVAMLDWDGTDAASGVSQPAEITNQKLATGVMNEFSQLYIEQVTDTALGGTLDANQTAFKTALTTESNAWHDWATAVNAAANDAANLNIDLVSGSYESFIWAKEGSKIEKAISDIYAKDSYNNNWTVDIADMDLKYGYTSNTSASTYVYPELWIMKHLEASIKIN